MILDSTTRLSRDLKHGIWGALTMVSLFPSLSLRAAECNILQLQKSHIPGLSVTNNRCPNATALSPQSVIEIQGGSRLWIETIGTSRESTKFQIICQNQEATPIKVKFADKFMPWVAPVGFSNCTGWIENRLTCYSAGQQMTALLCVIAQKQDKPAVSKIQPKTSVTMRGVGAKPPERPAIDASFLADLPKPNIELCRKIVSSNIPLTIKWVLKPSKDKAFAPEITNPLMLTAADRQFAACVHEAIENTAFPSVTSDISLSATF
jgi:hypothetical protein